MSFHFLSLCSSSSPFFHGTLPKSGHTGYSRPGPGDWVATPLTYSAHARLPLPDWGEHLSYPSDFGLPITRPSGR